MYFDVGPGMLPSFTFCRTLRKCLLASRHLSLGAYQRNIHVHP